MLPTASILLCPVSAWQGSQMEVRDVYSQVVKRYEASLCVLICFWRLGMLLEHCLCECIRIPSLWMHSVVHVLRLCATCLLSMLSMILRAQQGELMLTGIEWSVLTCTQVAVPQCRLTMQMQMHID